MMMMLTFTLPWAFQGELFHPTRWALLHMLTCQTLEIMATTSVDVSLTVTTETFDILPVEEALTGSGWRVGGEVCKGEVSFRKHVVLAYG